MSVDLAWFKQTVNHAPGRDCRRVMGKLFWDGPRSHLYQPGEFAGL